MRKRVEVPEGEAKPLGQKKRTAETAETAKATIKVQSEDRAVAEALAALAGHGDFYQRSGDLVRVIPATVATLGRVNTPWLRETLAKRCQFLNKKDTPILVPEWLAAMLLDRRVWPEVAVLRGLVTVPVFLADGRVLDAPGLDTSSGLYFAPRIPWAHAVPASPSRGDAEMARDLLFEVVQDFSFASDPSPECHRAAWLAFLLTLVGRFAVDGPAPFALVDAPSQGSGKGLLVKVASVIALGVIAPTTQASGDEEELRKALLPILDSGQRLGWLDDVSNPFGGRTWNALITSWPEYSDRVLGSSTQRRVPTTTTWAVTGNNLSLRGDSTRRALHIRIEPICEHPEERGGFHHSDLVGWVQGRQSELLAAALTILRAYHLAGRPSSGLAPAGSFEAWSKVIRDCVFWLTGQDCVATQRALGAVGDESRIALASLFAAICGHFPDSSFSASDFLGKLEADPQELAAAQILKRGPGELNAKALGHVLRTHRGAIVEGYRLDAVPGNRRTAYRITQVAVSAVSAVSDLHHQEKADPSIPFPTASGDGLHRRI